MTKYKLYRGLFIFYLVAGGALIFTGFMPVWIFWTVLLIFFTVLIAGVFVLKLSFFMPVIARGDKTQKQLLLTFDDGPDPALTPQVLDILDENGVQAVFFCIGMKVKKNPELVSEMVSRGHVVGVHSMSHSLKFTFGSTDYVKREIRETGQLIEEITGESPVLFRPPYGVSNPHIAKAVRGLGYKTIGWSLRSLDTILDKEKIKSRIYIRLGSGKVILLHDNRKTTVDILQELISHCRSSGYIFSGIREMLGIKPYRDKI